MIHRPKIMSDAFSKNMLGTCPICYRKNAELKKGLCSKCYYEATGEPKLYPYDLGN